ncbi:MAG: phosphoribosyltransferase family protein [Candidatus Nanopelagicales bacterium]
MFTDRTEAGKQLAQALLYLAPTHPIVLALPRGGVPVAYQVAESLDAELDVLIVRKLGVPWHPEYAFGAIGENGVTVVDRGIVRATGMTDADVDRTVTAETAEITRRGSFYRGDRPLPDVSERTVIVVDDGLATGSTMAAAVAVVKHLGAGRIVVAVPVGAPDAVRRIGAMVQDIVCLQSPANFRAVGLHYGLFDQVQDDEVIRLLKRARNDGPTQEAPAPGLPLDTEVLIPAGEVQLPGHLTLPASARGTVLFAHGSGSSRHSSRNRYVAQVLNEAGLGTLLFDLLTDPEASDRANVFDINLLAGRLVAATQWLLAQPATQDTRIGYFGASTGAGAALVAAAKRPDVVSAVVSRGGRPDLAGPLLPLVQAPTLLIVGGNDQEVIELNRSAQRAMQCPCGLTIVPGATHLFEEPGTLAAAARLAREHFLVTLNAEPPSPGSHETG